MYLYDAHVHTKESSLCGHVPAKAMVEAYRELQYTGIAITDHLNEENMQGGHFQNDWQAYMDHFLHGYRQAKAQGDAADFDVVLGAEIRFLTDDSDYLLFGIDEAFLRENPFLHRTTLKQFYKKYHKQLLIVRAHPFRFLEFPVLPKYLHGVEAINCNERHPNRNEMAFALAKKHTHLLKICGSDAHRPEDIGRAALIFPQRHSNSIALQEGLVSGNYTMFAPEFDHLLQQNR